MYDYMDYGDISLVVIDNGSGTIRVGFAGDEDPTCVNSTVIDRPRSYTKCEIFFEKFKVPAFYMSMQCVLSSYWSGRGSAIMLEIGDGVTHIVPVCKGYCIQPAIRRLDFGGRDLTFYLQTLLHDKGHDFVTTGDFEIVREMKEKLCYVAEDYSKEITRSECFPDIDKSYELPDGNLITIGKERLHCSEMLFRPSKGFAKRLQKEFAALIPERMLTNVVAPPERKDSSWIGGSILASLSTFQSMWITKTKYEEYGPDIVNRKCF